MQTDLRNARFSGAAALLAVIVLALSACSNDPSEASQGGTASVSVSYFTNTLPGLPVEVAQQEGFFKENSLDVTIESGTSAPALLQPVAAGQSDVTIIPASVAAPALGQGSALRAVVATGGGSTVVVGDSVDVPDADYPESAQALAGKTIAITAPGGYSDQLFKYIGSDAGVPGMEYVTVAGVAENIAALESGRVDAVNLDPISAIRVQRMGLGEILYDLQQTGPDSLLNVPVAYGWANEEFADDEASKAFAKSIAQAVEWIRDPANSKAVGEHIKTLLGDQEVDISEQELVLVRGAFVAYVSPEGLAASFEIAGADVDGAGAIDKDAPTSQSHIEALVGE